MFVFMFYEVFTKNIFGKDCLSSCLIIVRKMNKIQIQENTIFEIFVKYGLSGPPCWRTELSEYICIGRCLKTDSIFINTII